jgi:prevent-host-death family protein
MYLDYLDRRFPMAWRIAEAKNRLSELLDRVDEEGPQEIRRRGKVYVVSSLDEGSGAVTNRFVQIITNGPSWEGLEIERVPGSMREVDL